jgi:pilus assembly protein CpaF
MAQVTAIETGGSKLERSSQGCQRWAPVVDSDGRQHARLVVPYKLLVQEKGQEAKLLSFDKVEITVGRVNQNDIVLEKGNVSKKHVKIVHKDGKFVVADLKSTNGTFVNGRRINAPHVLKEDDKVTVGDFTIGIAEVEGDDDDLFAGDAPPAPAVARQQTPPPEAPRPEPRPEPQRPERLDTPRPEVPAAPTPSPAAKATPRVETPARFDAVEPLAPPRLETPRPEMRPTPAPRKHDGLDAAPLPSAQALAARAAVFTAVLKSLLDNKFCTELGLPLDDAASVERATATIDKMLANPQIRDRLRGVAIDGWSAQMAAELTGGGPLTALLEDQSVVEVFINGPHQVLLRRSTDASSLGVPLSAGPAYFSSDEALSLVIRRMMLAAGVPFDADNPIAEARLPDGSRVNAVHQSTSVRGPLVTISRSSTRNASLQALISEGVLSKPMADFLELCVRSRRNVCVCGGPGAQVGTVLSAMVATIPDDERIVVVEQVARLKLNQPHAVTLEPRPLHGGPSPASMRDLVANALRMRPNRLVVHEVTGAEAHDLFTAMGGRQDGTLFTAYAATTRDCLDRLETLMATAGLDVQRRVLREQIAASLDIVVTVTRYSDGSSKVTEISEVTGVEVDLLTLQDLFTFKRERLDENGVQGRFLTANRPPRFYDELQRRGDAVNLAIFRGE